MNGTVGKKLVMLEPIPMGEVTANGIIVPETCVSLRWGRITHVGSEVVQMFVGDEVLYDPVFSERGTLLDGQVISYPKSFKAIRRDGKLFAGDGKILVSVASRWLESNIGTPGILLTRSYEDWRAASNVERKAKVEAVGHGVDDILVGDMAHFHFDTLLFDENRILAEGIDLWEVSCHVPEWVYAVDRDGNTLAVCGWALIAPEKMEAKKYGGQLIVDDEPEKLSETVGTVHRVAPNDNIAEGEKVMFHADDAWLNDFGDEKLYAMRVDRIFGKIEA